MDLTDPTKQANTIKPVVKQIRPALAAIDELALVDNDYQSKVAAAKGNVLSLKACYVNLIKDHSGASGDTRVTNAKTFYEGRILALDALDAKIKSELDSLPTAKEKLTKFLTDLDNTKSSETVGEITDAYFDQSGSGEIPDASTVIERKGERDKIVSDNETDLGPTGDITTMKTDCVAIRTDLERQALNP